MYDIVLIEKPGELGLTKAEVMDMCDSLNGDEAYPSQLLLTKVRSLPCEDR